MKKHLLRFATSVLACLSMAGCGGHGNSGSQGNTSTPTLSSINVSASTNSVSAGLTVQLSATGTYSDGSTANLTSEVSWATSDNTIASVGTGGLVTTVKAGPAKITATMASVSGNITLTVGQAVLTSISVSGSSSPTTGTSEQLTAQGTYSDRSTQPLTSLVTWQSSDSAVATVNGSGVLTAVTAGSTTVTASLGSVNGTMAVLVAASGGNGGSGGSGTTGTGGSGSGGSGSGSGGSGGGGGSPTVTAILVNPNSFSVASGQTMQLAADAVYSDGTLQDVTTQATWSSSAPNFLTVGSNGLAVGVSTGSSMITATLGSVSGSCTGTVTSILLKSIIVTPSSGSLAIGQTQTYAANGIFSDGSTTDMTNSVTWSSSAMNVATVDATGLATGVAAGSSSISATSGSVVGSASLTVTAATLVAIDISHDGQAIPIGGQYQLTLTGTYSNNTTQTLANATWSSSDTTLATVDPNTGVITGVANSNGNPVTITATAAGMSTTTTVYVTSAVAESLMLTPATASIAKGTTEQYSVNAIYSDGTIQPVTAGLTWSSSSPATAGINSTGLARGRAAGQTTIAAAYSSLTGTATLTVTPATLTSVVVTPAVPVVGVHGNVQFCATGVFTDGSTEDLTTQATWSSSAASVALINGGGLATGLTNGTSTIAASYGGVSGSTTLTVTTATLVSISITPSNPIVPPHARLQLAAIGTFSDGSTAQLSGVTWWTSSGRYANVSGSGLLRTKKASNQPVVVNARLNGVTGQTSLTVTTLSVATLSLTPVNPAIAVGTKQAFKLVGTYSDGVTEVDLTASAQWQTSNYKAAVINRSGVATGLSSGSVTITGSWASLSPATATLTVSTATIQSIQVTPASPTIILGAMQQFTATGSFSDGSTQDISTIVQWSSSDPAVAVVNSTGMASSASHGQTDVTAKFGGESGAAVLNVN